VAVEVGQGVTWQLTADTNVNTLDGRRALSTHKGIIIQNGQKYVSK
jgi:hypothetical protein